MKIMQILPLAGSAKPIERFRRERFTLKEFRRSKRLMCRSTAAIYGASSVRSLEITNAARRLSLPPSSSKLIRVGKRLSRSTRSRRFPAQNCHRRGLLRQLSSIWPTRSKAYESSLRKGKRLSLSLLMSRQTSQAITTLTSSSKHLIPQMQRW